MAGPTALPGVPGPPPGSDVVDWITDGTRRDRTVRAAIPGGYARYAVLELPDGDRSAADAALVEELAAHGPAAPWWLGYLDTGVADVGPSPERVGVYLGWPYALRQSGPAEALAPRRHTPWHSALPELIFPTDRSWLVSTLWDDDHRCIGGPAGLVEALLARREVGARRVGPDEELAPG